VMRRSFFISAAPVSPAAAAPWRGASTATGATRRRRAAEWRRRVPAPGRTCAALHVDMDPLEAAGVFQ